jgi:DAACS family dicarboxylate/amino acid:cation (Na+ or H+) symporter
MPLHTKILLALVLGALAGIGVNLAAGGGPATQWFVSTVTEPIGRVWLNALIMVVIPLILATLSVGVAGLGDLKKLGRIGAITLLTFLSLTALSTLLGLTVVNIVKPGEGLDPGVRTQLMETYRTESEGAMGLAKGALGIHTFVNMVPRNPIKAAADGEMLAVIVFSLFLGVGLTIVGRDRAAPLLKVLESLGHVTVAIIGLVMLVAPLGVFCLIFSVTARFGFGILLQLFKYVVTVIGCLAAFQFIAYPLIVKFVARRSPMEFLRKARIVMVTAFSTSSSSATLPTTLRTAQEDLKVAPEIAGFVVPLGATMNMNGTSLFEGVTVLFIAEVFGLDLTLAQQAIVVMMAVVTAIGTAGIPGGSIPLLMMVLGTVGVPMEGIAIVLGVDRILDMCRTTLNVTGDLVTSLVVDRFEGRRAAAAPARAL